MKVLLLVLVVLMGRAEATLLEARNLGCGTLASAQATTGASANQVNMGEGFGSALFSYVNATGTATVALEVNCANAGWVTVTGSSKALTVSNDAVGIDNPICVYRSNVTACSGCSVTATYCASRRLP